MAEVPAITVAFTEREWERIDRLANGHGVSPVAIVRACVQQVLSGHASAPAQAPRELKEPPPPRVCPGCNNAVLVKKNPHGPGRYPSLCEECR